MKKLLDELLKLHEQKILYENTNGYMPLTSKEKDRYEKIYSQIINESCLIDFEDRFESDCTYKIVYINPYRKLVRTLVDNLIDNKNPKVIEEALSSKNIYSEHSTGGTLITIWLGNEKINIEKGTYLRIVPADISDEMLLKMEWSISRLNIDSTNLTWYLIGNSFKYQN